MADNTPTLPSAKQLLSDELAAIKSRIEKAAEKEVASLKGQFGQRVAHLEERLKALVEPTPPTPMPPAK